MTYGANFFGEGFIERMEQNYVEAGRVRNRVVHRPKPRGSEVTIPR